MSESSCVGYLKASQVPDPPTSVCWVIPRCERPARRDGLCIVHAAQADSDRNAGKVGAQGP